MPLNSLQLYINLVIHMNVSGFERTKPSNIVQSWAVNKPSKKGRQSFMLLVSIGLEVDEVMLIFSV